MHVAVPLFERFTALDAVGSYEVLQRVPSIDVTFIGLSARRGPQLVELLVGREAAEASQLMIEYDPEPPFDAGSLGKASQATHQRALDFYHHRA